MTLLMPTHFTGSHTETRTLDTFIKLTRCTNSLFARLSERNTLGDLTPSQFAVLEALFHLGSMTQGEVSLKVLKSGSNITTVIDNLERALATDASASPEQLRHGVHLTLQQLRELLRRHGIEHEESLGQSFDPHRHEAIRVGHDPTLPDHSVLEVIQRGYRRGEAVFRPAKVVVNDLSQPDKAGLANHAG
jgi:DNA-binding MarR family transcriptional regulator